MKAKNLAAYTALAAAATACIAVAFIVLYVTKVSNGPVNADERCGGVLEGDYGKLEHEFSSDSGTSNCLWIIRLAHGNGVRITVTRLTTTMTVYTEQRGVDGSLLPTILGTPNVGTPVELSGKFAVIILPAGASSRVDFSWDTVDRTADGPATTIGYVDADQGVAEWHPYKPTEDLAWAFVSSEVKAISWQMAAQDGVCATESSCICSFLGIYKVTMEGVLEEFKKTCGGAVGEYSSFKGQLVVFAHINTTKYMEVSFRMSWSAQSPPGVTSTASISTTTAKAPTEASTMSDTEEPPVETETVPVATTLKTTSSQTASTGSTGEPTGKETTSHSSTSPSSYVETTEFSVMTSTGTSEATTSTSPGASETTTSSGPGETRVLLATNSGGLRIYTLESAATVNIGDTNNAVYGVTYDASNNRIFWIDYEPTPSSGMQYKVYGAKSDGKDAILLHTLGSVLYAIAFDWLVGNVYIATTGGVTVCNSTEAQCSNIVISEFKNPQGIALDPNNGYLYWTSRKDKHIGKAEMDGSGGHIILSSLNSPIGITIDYQASRLYWTSYAGNMIESSGLDGENRMTVVSLGMGTGPWGIDMWEGIVFWTTLDSGEVQSCTCTTECNPTTVYEAGTYLRDIAIMSASHQPILRRRLNDCDGQGCSHNCVLTSNSFRCICPVNYDLQEDRRTCGDRVVRK